ncbi:MAG: outer membrane protein assembly factor BamD [Moraxellaceae bacterium]|nr:MAG: outer membrane protein assembly factor BamD [Moraxellaceae bacterium]
MSLPRFSVLMLSLSVAIAGGMAGCSSFPSKKKDLKDAGPQRSEQAYYQSAQKSLKRGQFTEANKSLEALDTYYPTGEYTEQAQLDLMYSRFRQGDYPGVVTLADRFIRLYPRNAQLAYAYYIRGVSNMEQHYDGLLRYTNLDQAHRDVSYLRLAYSSLRDFVQRFPSSRYAVDAAQRMQYISQELAESEMNIARYNLKRQAWLAAVQRARWVLEYYPQTPQIPEALATMVYGYQKLGDQQTANQYLDIIRMNYPKLVKGNGVDLNAARGKASWVNRATLGIFGREAQSFVPKNHQNAAVVLPPAASPATSDELSSEQIKPDVTQPTLDNAVQQPAVPSIGLGLPELTSPQQQPESAPSNAP